TWLLLLITALGASWDFLDQIFAAIDGYRRRVWGDEVSREGARLGEQGVVMRIVGHKEEMWLVLWPRNGLEMLVSCLGMKEVHHQGCYNCNGGNLSGMIRVGNMTYFQNYEWYEGLEDGDLKDEALKEKAIFEGS
ncbi:hypothetical protein Tco_1130553, partial [Tanacetum coccineum]